MRKHIVLSLIMLVSMFMGNAGAADYFVNKNGADTSSGVERASAFLTIQKGVNALQPGDTLSIGPGEYLESVRRDRIGGADKDTVVRAEIPGTVLLRGDLPVQGFAKVDGSRFTYVTDVSLAGEVVVVNELDTLSILGRLPSNAELDFMPGEFFHDRAGSKVFLSTSDYRPVEAHRYSLSVIPTHGFYLSNARRVRIEGLAVTGFNALKEVPNKDLTLNSVWGIFVANGKDCVISGCHAYLNAQGIGINSMADTSGGNVIEKCVAWANSSHVGVGDRGGITVISPQRDVVRDCTSYLNGEIGINFRGGGLAGDEKSQSRMERNLAWGNAVLDFKIKAGAVCRHYADRCVGLGSWNFTGKELSLHGLVGHLEEDCLRDNIMLSEEKNLDFRAEFADPDNFDFRLQENSRFRKTGPDGMDRGPFQYEKNIFYVRSDGDDQSDGLSVGTAWKTLARGINALRAGDTLYLQPGFYQGDFKLNLQGKEGKPICIRGRGKEPVVINGHLQMDESVAVEFKRLYFTGEVNVVNGKGIVFDNCRFSGRSTGLKAERIDGLRVTHCEFTGFEKCGLDIVSQRLDASNGKSPSSTSSKVYLSGNLFDNRGCVALRLDRVNAIEYSNYNSYRNAAGGWEAGGKALPFAEVQMNHDQQSHELTPEYSDGGGVKILRNPLAFAAIGPLGKPIGLFRDEKRSGALRLVEKPKVHSVSATTANLEWTTSLPATCKVVWGETPEGSQTHELDVDCFGSFSLTGLKPGQTYYFSIQSLQTPAVMVDELGASTVAIKTEPLVFTTLKENPAPYVYYVAPDGNDSNSGLKTSDAWRTIQHAADTVNVGDIVMIAGGKYQERVRIRATGEAQAPIVFKAMPGEKVVMDGMDKMLNSFFIAISKKHLKFDGFYFVDSNRDRVQDGLFMRLGGEFKLYQCKDVEITRCFADGRGAYTARFVIAWQVENLQIRNCVALNKFSGTYFLRCPGLLIEHSVFARPMISSILLRNDANESAVMNNNIFTDNLKKKADLNISFMFVDLSMAAFRQSNNCYLVRSFPPDKRYIVERDTIDKLGDYIHDPLFVDPLFAGDPDHSDKTGFAPDRLMDPSLKLDFNSFFATNPELVKRGMGLQPEAFKDFVFKPVSSPVK